MKFCERCGEEIATKDGENLCPQCDEVIGLGIPQLERADARRRRVRFNRRQRESMLKSLGLVKVRGALGGTYWE